MDGQIVLIGYDKKGHDKLLKVEASCEGNEADETVDTVYFPDLDVSIKRKLLLDAIEFLRAH